MSYNIYTGLLKAFALPAAAKTATIFKHDHNHPKFNQLKTTYPIETTAGTSDDFTKAKNLLNWVSCHIYHKGNYSGSTSRNALDLLNSAFNKGSEHGINCVCLSVILTECLLAIGIKAKTVFIMPCSPYDGDNHCVTQAYITGINKWVMLDPTLNAYFTNQQEDYLSLLELRNCLANHEPVFFNKEAKYNDDTWTDETAKDNIEYFAKNLFYFQTHETHTFYTFEAPSNRFITLSPQGYDPKQVGLSNIDYRIKTYGDNPNMQAWKEGAEKEEFNFCSTADFENPNPL